jgi:hypothetical protein
LREDEITSALRSNVPFADLPGISVESVTVQSGPPDLAITLMVAGRKLALYGELKNNCSPLAVAQLAPWLRQLKQARPKAGVALVCPSLSPESQRICLENGIDFIDLAGNVSIQIPGILYVYRVGRRLAVGTGASFLRDPFSGRASRVLRILLEKPRPWRIVELAGELEIESKRAFDEINFNISVPTISKTVKSLTEQLLVRREDSTILIPEPKRLLLKWADKYRERYRWRLRSSFKLRNPFGENLLDVSEGLQSKARGFAFTGVAAAMKEAPYVDLNAIDVMVPREYATSLGSIESRSSRGPDIRIILPYDPGVFLYRRDLNGIPLVSPVQVFLDLYARGGRDLKQAEHYLATLIEPRWSTS